VAGVVADASAVVELLLRTGAGRRAAERIGSAEYVAAPAHLDAEVLSALARMVRADVVDSRFVGPALAELTAAPILRFPIAELTADAWALRDNVAIRDALYVALARALGAELLTADGPLARTPSLGVTVTFVGD